MSCKAVVRPASPTTYADPLGRWSSRNWAVASADVQIASSGTSMPLASSLARRSRGVNTELLVRTMNGQPDRFRASTNSTAPGIGSSSCTRTPSMSVSQVSMGLGSVMDPVSRAGPCGPTSTSVDGAEAFDGGPDILHVARERFLRAWFVHVLGEIAKDAEPAGRDPRGHVGLLHPGVLGGPGAAHQRPPVLDAAGVRVGRGEAVLLLVGVAMGFDEGDERRVE